MGKYYYSDIIRNDIYNPNKNKKSLKSGFLYNQSLI